MTPRPILKALSSHDFQECFPPPSAALPFKFLHSPHVHFPPTPTLTSTQTTYSPFAYDRAPIVVCPNTCALPERGGRVYTPQTPQKLSRSPRAPKGSYFHPQAFEVYEPEPPEQHLALEPPLLMSDTFSSSESDESDGYPSSPCHPPVHDTSIPYPGDIPNPIPHASLQEGVDSVLSFLPYPPSQKARRKTKRKESRNKLKVHIRDEYFRSMSDEMSLSGCLDGF